jgi:hypothetical protein
VIPNRDLSAFVRKAVRLLLNPSHEGAAALFLCFLPALASCADSVTYEFWSCDRSKNEVMVLKMPKSYKPTAPAAALNTRVSIHHAETGGLNRTSFFSTYPEFDPIETATEEQKKVTEAALFNTAVSSGTIDYGNAIDFFLLSAVDDPTVKRTSEGQRFREESLDGKYWVYPDPSVRNGKGGSDLLAYFLPKDTGRNVLISCRDMKTNVFPPDNYRCEVRSLMLETPALSCMTVSYRIRAADVPQWRDFDARIKAKIKSMITVRQP